MNANAFFHLRPRIKAAVDSASITRLSPEEVHDVLTRPDNEAAMLEETGAAVAAAAAAEADAASFDLASADFMSARGLESIVALAQNHLMNPFASSAPAPPLPIAPAAPVHHPHSHSHTHAHALLPLGIDVAASPTGPSAGSSVRARKQAKRMMSEVPGGAATPVAKKRREEVPGVDDVDLAGDTSFLDSL
jgi:hypothetical protein